MPSKNQAAIIFWLLIIFPYAINRLVELIQTGSWYRAAIISIALSMLFYALKQKQEKAIQL